MSGGGGSKRISQRDFVYVSVGMTALVTVLNFNLAAATIQKLYHRHVELPAIEERIRKHCEEELRDAGQDVSSDKLAACRKSFRVK